MKPPSENSPEDVSTQLTVLNEIAHELAQCQDIAQIKGVRDQAEAVRNYAKAAQLSLEFQNRAAEIKLRAERRAGQLLAKLKLRGGDRKSNGHDDRLKLEDLGINQSQSKRWQRVASVPETAFAAFVARANAIGAEITGAGLLRLAGSSRTSGKNCVRARRIGQATKRELVCEKIAELRQHQQTMLQFTSVYESNAIDSDKLFRLTRRYLLDMQGILQEIENILFQDT